MRTHLMLLVVVALCLTSSFDSAQGKLSAAAPTARPEDVGLSTERLTRIGELMQRHIAAKTFAGAVSRVARTTVRRELDNLAALGAVASETRQVATTAGRAKADGTARVVKTMKTHYRLADEFAGYCENVGGV